MVLVLAGAGAAAFFALTAGPSEDELAADAAAHGEVVSVIASGADAMNAAYDGLEDSQYCYTSDYGGCNYRETPGWERFQTVSDQNTGGFDSARAQWQEKIDSLDKKLGSRNLPEQPEV